MRNIAYSYVRFSSPAQAGGDSFRRQTEAARKYCQDNNLELSDFTLRDLGLSAYHGNHVKDGALGEFIQAVQDGQIQSGSYLLVESMDRLSREKLSVALDRFLKLLRLGIQVVTLQDRKVFNSDSLDDISNIVLSLMLMMRAHEESSTKSKRLKSAHEQKRKEAILERKPTGYTTPNWIKTVNGQYELIPERVAVLQRIFKLSITGCGAIAIAKLLNDEGVMPWGRSKTGWQTSYVKKLLRSRTVLGEYLPHKKIDGKRIPEGQPIQGFYPAAIEPMVFHQADIAIKSRMSQSSSIRKGRLNNILVGLVKCSHCGSTMHYIDKGRNPKKGGQYLVCSLARLGATVDGKKCHYASMRYVDVEAAVLRVAAILKLNFDTTDNSEVISGLREELSNQEQERNDLQMKVETLLDQLEIMFGDKGLTERYAQRCRELDEVKQKCLELESNIQRLEVNTSGESVLKTLSKGMRRYKHVIDNPEDIELRCRFQRELNSLLQRIDIDGHNKLVTLWLDDNRSVQLDFKKRDTQEVDADGVAIEYPRYYVRPSWERNEYTPRMFGVRFAFQSAQPEKL